MSTEEKDGSGFTVSAHVKEWGLPFSFRLEKQPDVLYWQFHFLCFTLTYEVWR